MLAELSTYFSVCVSTAFYPACFVPFQIWEQNPLPLAHCVPLCVARSARGNLKRGRKARLTELHLSHFQRRTKSVQQYTVSVPESMPVNRLQIDSVVYLSHSPADCLISFMERPKSLVSFLQFVFHPHPLGDLFL